MEKLKDAEILARLIYRAYIAPDPHAPLEAEALLPCQAALELYARVWQHDREVAVKIDELMNLCARCQDEDEPCSDACPITPAEPEPAAPDHDAGAADKLDGFEPVPLRAHDTHTHTAGANDGGEPAPKLFAGYGAGEKREIHARLIAFVASHGLGARRRIAEASNGVLTQEEVRNMTDAKRVTLSKWQAAAAAMDRIEEQDNAD